MIPFSNSSSNSASDVGGKKLKIKSSQPLIGTKTRLEVGEVVTQVGEEDMIDMIMKYQKHLNGYSILSNIYRMILYKTVPSMREDLDKHFPSEVRFVGEDADRRIIHFIEDVIRFGTASVRKARLFMVGHQGSGKTSLAHSLRSILGSFL